MNRRGWHALCCGLLLMILAAGKAVWADEPQLVLVVAEASPVNSLSQSQLRRLFLGLPVVVDGQRLVPLLNRSEPLVYQVFLQNLVYLSARHYERRLLSQVLRFGGSRPVKYTDQAALLEALRQNPRAVSFMWKRLAEDAPGIRVIGEL